MKFKKIILVLIVLTFIISTFSFNSYAEDINYNQVIAVKVDGENIFYNLHGLSNTEWDNYIKYCDGLYGRDNSPFGVLDGYVIYNDCFLINKSGQRVMTSHTVTVAAGCVYTLKPIYSLNDNTLVFDSELDFELTFEDIINNVRGNIFTVEYKSGTDSYVYFKAQRMILSNGANVAIGTNIGNNTVFNLLDECSHDYLFESYIQKNTCVSNGSANYFCRWCKVSTVMTIPSNPDYGHEWTTIYESNPTCQEDGIRRERCVYCDKDSEYVWEEAWGHDFVSPTCEENGYCSRCGAEGDKALGHDMRLGFCKRCDYRESFGAVLGNAGSWISDKANIAGRWIIDKCNKVLNKTSDVLANGADLIQNGAEAIVNGDSSFIDYVKGILLSVPILVVLAAVLVFLYYGMRIYNNVNTFAEIQRRKKTRKRKRRRRKRRKSKMKGKSKKR